ncbi:hypothetical protein HK102_012976 [Quaeritorhiza haematococci]|nr:hypothetical protein HK102_012976 [Quaeritorhiza haematococci]
MASDHPASSLAPFPNLDQEPLPINYVEVVRKWENNGCDSLPQLTPLDRLEHTLLKLFFFDVIEVISEDRMLMPRAKYIVWTLLRLAQNKERDGKLEGGGGIGGGEDGRAPERSEGSFEVDGLSSEIGEVNQQAVVALQNGDKTFRQEPVSRSAHSAVPTLPIEVIEVVLSHLEASVSTKTYEHGFDWQRNSKFRRLFLSTFSACALVDRRWHSVATPFLWRVARLNNPRVLYRFLDDVYNNSWGRVQTGDIRILSSRLSVTKLKLFCRDGQYLWQTVVRNLFLFPNLRRLTLDGPGSPDDLSLLFDQDLPSLEHLTMCAHFKMDADRSGGASWDYGPSVDRERARAFFSRLISVKFSWHFYLGLDTHTIRCPVLMDVAHSKLRRITIPEQIPDWIVREFVQNSSHALSVMCLVAESLYPSTLEDVGKNCAGLRALRLREGVNPEEFRGLMKVRGSQLVALQLGIDGLDYFEEPGLLPLVTDYCRSLEYLSVALSLTSSKAASIEEDLVNLVQQCGPSLRYLSVYLQRSYKIDWAISTATLISTVARCCPLLRGLRFQVLDVIADSSESEQNEALTQLLQNCSHLHTLQLGSSLLTIPDNLRAKLRTLNTSWEGPKKKYFDWRTYPLPADNTPTPVSPS